jgi:hypothetical protein
VEVLFGFAKGGLGFFVFVGVWGGVFVGVFVFVVFVFDCFCV